ncbi:hypothetical protein [Cupriavidus sp. CP313]
MQQGHRYHMMSLLLSWPAAPGEKLDEQQDGKQGAPTAASNPDDGSDSSDDCNDSKN